MKLALLLIALVAHAGVLGAPYRSASQLGLTTPADSGYEGAGQGVKVPVKQPGCGQVLEVVPGLVELEVAVPHLSPAVR